MPTNLSTSLRSSIADLQTRHAALITSVRNYKDNSVGAATAEIIAAAADLDSHLIAEESTLLGQVALKSTKPQPSLSLDFLEQVYLMGSRRLERGYGFGDLITFSRGSAGGRFNSSGVYEMVAAGQPRFDYDPVTKAAKGLLVEEQRTNLLTYSVDFSNAAWTKTNANTVSNAAIAPDGTQTATKLVETTANGQHRINSVAISMSGVHSGSVFAKAGERNICRMFLWDATSRVGETVFDLAAGTVVSGPGVIKPAGNGWYRCSVAGTSAGTTGQLFCAVGALDTYGGDGASGLYVWGAQLEAGAFPTSYIPTTSAQVTRAADLASVNSLSPWFNSVEGALSAESSTFATTAFPTVVELVGDILIFQAMSNKQFQLNGRGSPGFAAVAGRDPGSVNKTAMSYDDAAASLAANGGTISTSERGRISPTTGLRAGGRGGTAYLNGHLRRIRYYPRRLTNTELQSITA
ncbi:hypothetical protein FQZ97_229260 [compost metagenome]